MTMRALGAGSHMNWLLLVTLTTLVFTTGCGGSEPNPVSEENGRSVLITAGCDEEFPSTCPGADMPEFDLVDFQPDSPYFEETYGRDRFRGGVTGVALWAAG